MPWAFWCSVMYLRVVVFCGQTEPSASSWISSENCCHQDIAMHIYKEHLPCRCVNNKTMYTHTSESRWSMRESAGADTSLSFDESCKHWVIQLTHYNTQGLPVYIPVVCQWHLLWSAQTVQPWPSDLVPHHYQSPPHCYTIPKTVFMKDNVTNTVDPSTCLVRIRIIYPCSGNAMQQWLWKGPLQEVMCGCEHWAWTGDTQQSSYQNLTPCQKTETIHGGIRQVSNLTFISSTGNMHNLPSTQPWVLCTHMYIHVHCMTVMHVLQHS